MNFIVLYGLLFIVVLTAVIAMTLHAIIGAW